MAKLPNPERSRCRGSILREASSHLANLQFGSAA
jgi:hypothetical protein